MQKKYRKLSKLIPFIPGLLFAVLLLNGCGKSRQYLTIKGSDTMVHLVSNWAEEFMQSHKDVIISVTGGGSGTGIAALINGTTDICMASRKIKGKEIKLATEKGLNLKEDVVARDGIALVVNPKNPVNELDLAELKNIYTAKFETWAKVGGKNAKITILSRESSSGTYVFFQEHVLKKEDYAVSARRMPATSAIIQAVAADVNAIGYVGLGYALANKNKVKIVAIKKNSSAPSYLPAAETINKELYPIARGLNIYTSKNSPAKNIAAEFLAYCYSPAGQKIVKDTGYIPVK